MSDIKNGADFAHKLLPLIMDMESVADSQVKWWAGFLGALSGGAGASIGPEAVIVINNIVKGMVDAENHKRAN